MMFNHGYWWLIFVIWESIHHPMPTTSAMLESGRWCSLRVCHNQLYQDPPWWCESTRKRILVAAQLILRWRSTVYCIVCLAHCDVHRTQIQCSASCVGSHQHSAYHHCHLGPKNPIATDFEWSHGPMVSQHWWKNVSSLPGPQCSTNGYLWLCSLVECLPGCEGQWQPWRYRLVTDVGAPDGLQLWAEEGMTWDIMGQT